MPKLKDKRHDNSQDGYRGDWLKRERDPHGLATIRADDLARLLNTTPWTLRRWVRQGRFPKPLSMVNGGPSLWLRRDIDAHIEKRRRSRTKPRPTVGNLKQYGRCGTCKAAQASVTSNKRKPLAGWRAARG